MEVWRILYSDALPSARINRANFAVISLPGGGVSLKKFPGMRYVVTCDICEYFKPCATRYEAEVIRVSHLSSTHSDLIIAGQATYHLSREMPT